MNTELFALPKGGEEVKSKAERQIVDYLYSKQLSLQILKTSSIERVSWGMRVYTFTQPFLSRFPSRFQIQSPNL